MSFNRAITAIQAARLAVGTVDSNRVADLAEEVIYGALFEIVFEQQDVDEDDEEEAE